MKARVKNNITDLMEELPYCRMVRRIINDHCDKCSKFESK